MSPSTVGSRPVVRATVVVWLDSREARIARFVPTGDDSGAVAGERPDRPSVDIDRITSDVPAHHHGTGHVRIHPPGRHGGGGGVEDRIEGQRIEHLRAFVAQVAALLEPDADVAILGPGVVRERLAAELRAHARGHGVPRTVSERASAVVTDAQLRALVLELNGHAPRRRLV